MVLACFTELVNCSGVSSSGRHELTCDEAVMGNDASNYFAVSSTFRLSALVICVSSDISLSRSSYRQVVMGLVICVSSDISLSRSSYRQVVMGQQLSEYQVKHVHR